MNQTNDCQFFDEADFVLPTFIRGVSDDIFVSAFFCPKPDISQIHPFSICQQQQEPILLNTTYKVPDFLSLKKPKPEAKKQGSNSRKDYKKNICGYITKKIVRQFIGQTYKQKVLDLCLKHDCDYKECISFYDKKIERITGPTHLDMLLKYNKECPQVIKCFREFFNWFLRHRYLRHLIIEGKMEKKDSYIDYKNKTLLYLSSLEDDNTENRSSYIESESKQTSPIF